MSTIIHEDDQLKVSVFYGGDERGPCLQITMQECYDDTLLGAAQVDLAGAIQLYNTLGDWIKGECERRQKLLREEIRNMKDMEKTIFHEVAHLNSSLIGNNTLAAEYILKFAPAVPRRLAREVSDDNQ